MTEKRQGRRSAQDAQKTRYHILKVAAAMFCELGYARVSLRSISEKAGVSHSLIRHHFGSKEKIWHSISDGLHLYMQHYIREVLDHIPDSTPANIKLYSFIMRLLAHGLIIKQPMQLIADAVRQEDALFDYFIDTAGELECMIEGVAAQYNQEFPDTPVQIWEFKWQMIMYTHSAASLTPFLKETWSRETDSLDECLLRHWQLFNEIMVHKFNVPDDQVMRPKAVKDLVYSLNYNWEKHCAQMCELNDEEE
ncbi:TetR/AcrR family transcriptional regulator [Vibrio sp. Vb2880]|uniref:TetR family transcriptional regulator n=2 Tax=Vibrio furnissii TaxID=29494 RepID=A0A0Q2Y735_VIBFU|nr:MULTISPECIES: TetR/AcrR family transcriptional regulator [Vibrio]KQH88068.1 TetR family transcriptional regulator [Vibrio furnissii]MBO0213698.1 TetR/AcrR family transcriptional regulator [Vibrio sp. Vb2880]MCG6214056.1 TetR/AcrR family transcriptional regulator [Vibrio furnissii]MCG6217281.1 TetR/AcrR family transcriptional regulator [Vibrio furnissii]MCG6228878.1 TetR/AcrR family transcriptional regulator [Vibrio furnissii]